MLFEFLAVVCLCVALFFEYACRDVFNYSPFKSVVRYLWDIAVWWWSCGYIYVHPVYEKEARTRSQAKRAVDILMQYNRNVLDKVHQHGNKDLMIEVQRSYINAVEMVLSDVF